MKMFPLFAMLLAVVPLIGCEREEQKIVPDAAVVEGEMADVTLQLNWKPEPQFGGFYAAQRAGSYRKHGVDVAIQPGGAGAPTVDMLGAGRVEFAIVSADEIVRARANGNMLVALMAVYQINPQGIMTRASRGFEDIGDVFKNSGTLAMERGLPYSDFLKQKYGFDKLTIVPSPFGDLSMYRTKEDYAMQVFVTSEPLAAKKIGIEPKTFLIADAGYNPYTTVLATSESYLKAQPAVVASMVQAVREGWTAYLADPIETNSDMGKLNPTMDAETLAASAAAQLELIQTAETKSNGLGSMTLQRWQTLVQQLKELGTITTDVDPAKCFVTTEELQGMAKK
ncbi:MAG TPA: ABC transporter substrate-binding protein [Tepidisphaeraceae bacterium]|jgi:NitT/TauT family transport system substrate-binding protein|nr:ABC transporter substrate-binding protein [Tepidisphaeraceae bacterium]